MGRGMKLRYLWLIGTGLALCVIAFVSFISYRGILKMTDYDQAAVSDYLEQDLARKDLAAGAPIFMRIFKQSAELEIWVAQQNGTYTHYKTYPICSYSGHLGPKLKEGDRQAPEGFYQVSLDQLNPNSRYHLSFNLGFPNAYDRAHGWTGSFLMVHGNCVSIGCYAMTDELIEEIYRLTELALEGGQASVPVHIFPFRLEEAALAAQSDSPWYDFWRNLQQGYQAFEQYKTVPQIAVQGFNYVISGG